MASKKFKGTKTYVATDDLMIAVNAAVTLERPILIKGEPGTGKTQLALEPELLEVVEVWPLLDEPIQAAIVALARTKRRE